MALLYSEFPSVYFMLFRRCLETEFSLDLQYFRSKLQLPKSSIFSAIDYLREEWFGTSCNALALLNDRLEYSSTVETFLMNWDFLMSDWMVESRPCQWVRSASKWLPPFTASVFTLSITAAISGCIGACVAAILPSLLPLIRRDGEQSEVTVAGEGGGASRA